MPATWVSPLSRSCLSLVVTEDALRMAIRTQQKLLAGTNGSESADVLLDLFACSSSPFMS